MTLASFFNQKILMDFYYTIDTQGVAEFKDRGSKFLAYTFPDKNQRRL